MGWIKEATDGRLDTGMHLIAECLFLGGLLVLGVIPQAEGASCPRHFWLST